MFCKLKENKIQDCNQQEYDEEEPESTSLNEFFFLFDSTFDQRTYRV